MHERDIQKSAKRGRTYSFTVRALVFGLAICIPSLWWAQNYQV
jgi:hypothetical protein